jgi:hypothetical protein
MNKNPGNPMPHGHLSTVERESYWERMVRASEPVMARIPPGMTNELEEYGSEGTSAVESHSDTTVFMARLYSSIFRIESCMRLLIPACCGGPKLTQFDQNKSEALFRTKQYKEGNLTKSTQ